MKLLSALAAFLRTIKEGEILHLNSAESFLLSKEGNEGGIELPIEFSVPQWNMEVHPGETHCWIENILNPIFSAGSHLGLELAGLLDTSSNRFVPITDIPEDELDDFPGDDDQLHTLVYKVVPTE